MVDEVFMQWGDYQQSQSPSRPVFCHSIKFCTHRRPLSSCRQAASTKSSLHLQLIHWLQWIRRDNRVIGFLGKDDGIYVPTTYRPRLYKTPGHFFVWWRHRALRGDKTMANVGINSQIPLLRRNRAFLGVQYGYIDLANFSPPPSSQAVVCMWQVAGVGLHVRLNHPLPLSAPFQEDHQIGFSSINHSPLWWCNNIKLLGVFKESTLNFGKAQLNPELVCKLKCSLSGLQWPQFGGSPRPAVNSAPVSINWSNITRGTDIAPSCNSKWSQPSSTQVNISLLPAAVFILQRQSWFCKVSLVRVSLDTQCSVVSGLWKRWASNGELRQVWPCSASTLGNLPSLIDTHTHRSPLVCSNPQICLIFWFLFDLLLFASSTVFDEK